jgi:hypothetical protein
MVNQQIHPSSTNDILIWSQQLHVSAFSNPSSGCIRMNCQKPEHAAAGFVSNTISVWRIYQNLLVYLILTQRDDSCDGRWQTPMFRLKGKCPLDYTVSLPRRQSAWKIKLVRRHSWTLLMAIEHYCACTSHFIVSISIQFLLVPVHSTL